ncbi:ABC transporter permease [Methylobacterium sp. JK268]
MTPISLGIGDLALAASLVVLDAALSIGLRLGLHRQLLIAAARMVVQLVGVGYLLRAVFSLDHPAATALVILVMTLVAAREVAARPERRLRGLAMLGISLGGVLLATLATAGLALATAIRPTPWYDPRYAVPLAGIVLGSVLNAASLALDSLLAGLARERAAVEAQLALGTPFRQAVAGPFRTALRRGLLPVVNQMSAAGLVTLPGTMTGQILAGMDPVEAVKYQILLLFLLTGASGLAALAVTALALRRLTDSRERLRLDRLA